MEASGQFEIKQTTDDICIKNEVDEYMANLMKETRKQAVRIIADYRSKS